MAKEKNIDCKDCNRQNETLKDTELYAEKTNHERVRCVNVGCRVYQSINYLLKDEEKSRRIQKILYNTTLDELKKKKNTSSGNKQYKLIKDLLLQEPTLVTRNGSTINMEFRNRETYTFKNNKGEERFTITR